MKKKIKTYNDTLLQGNYYPYQEEREYLLDCKNDIIKHYLKPEKEQNSIDAYVESIKSFCQKLITALTDGKVHFAYYDGTSLIVKYRVGKTFHKDIFTLTKSAKENNDFMSFLNELPSLQPNYNELLIEEKHTKTLYSTYYNKTPLSFKEQPSLDEFINFYKSKLSILAKNKYKNYDNIRKKLSRYLPNLLSLFLLDGIIMCTIGWYPYGLGWQIVTKVGFLIAKEFLTDEVFKLVSISKVNRELKHAVSDNQSIIDSQSLEKSVEKELDEECLEDTKEKDEIIIEIEDYIRKIEVAQYDGYQKHLKILYGLAKLYLTAKKNNIGETTTILFGENEEFLTSLAAVESEIEACINDQSIDMLDETILSELALHDEESEKQIEETNKNDNNTLPGSGLVLKI